MFDSKFTHSTPCGGRLRDVPHIMCTLKQVLLLAEERVALSLTQRLASEQQPPLTCRGLDRSPLDSPAEQHELPRPRFAA